MSRHGGRAPLQWAGAGPGRCGRLGRANRVDLQRGRCSLGRRAFAGVLLQGVVRKPCAPLMQEEGRTWLAGEAGCTLLLSAHRRRWGPPASDAGAGLTLCWSDAIHYLPGPCLGTVHIVSCEILVYPRDQQCHP